MMEFLKWLGNSVNNLMMTNLSLELPAKRRNPETKGMNLGKLLAF